MDGGMNHRTYRGRISYIHDRLGETGREWFTVTVGPDGQRTVRALCEMDDDRVLRDVTYTVDGAWRPQDAFVRLSVADRFVGSAWFRFSEQGAECEAHLAREGRVSQRVDLGHRPPIFAPHPLVCDGWQAAAFDHSRPEMVQLFPGACNSSHMANGGSGPLIGWVDKKLEHVGDGTLTVPAGTFDVRHYRIILPDDRPPLLLWVTGEDRLLVRLSWTLLESRYDLVEVEM
jgi:hypothetical protein